MARFRADDQHVRRLFHQRRIHGFYAHHGSRYALLSQFNAGIQRSRIIVCSNKKFQNANTFTS